MPVAPDPPRDGWFAAHAAISYARHRQHSRPGGRLRSHLKEATQRGQVPFGVDGAGRDRGVEAGGVLEERVECFWIGLQRGVGHGGVLGVDLGLTVGARNGP